MIHRHWFFEHIRQSVFGGRLAQGHVDGLNRILDEADVRQLDFRHVAYIVATAYHETAHTMQPLVEYGMGKGRAYGRPDPATGHTYYGRGYVQLTWRANYQKMERVLGIPLVETPDLALVPEHALQILYEGMIRGLFTGHALADYFTASSTQWRNARQIVNGRDQAALIGDYAQRVHAALSWTPD